MMEEDNDEGKGHDTVTLGTGPAPACSFCLAATQDFPLHTGCPVASGDCDLELRDSRAPCASPCSRQRWFLRRNRAKQTLCPDRRKQQTPGEEAEAGAGWSKRKCLQSGLLWMLALSLDMAQGYKSGRAGRGLGDRTVHTLASQMRNPRPGEGREPPKAEQLHRDRAGLGSLCSWSGVRLGASVFTSPYRPPNPTHSVLSHQ